MKKHIFGAAIEFGKFAIVRDGRARTDILNMALSDFLPAAQKVILTINPNYQYAFISIFKWNLRINKML